MEADAKRLDELEGRARARWGTTGEWADFEARKAGRTKTEEADLARRLLTLFAPFHELAERGVDPASTEAYQCARAIQDFISDNLYACSDEVFLELGRAYGANDEFTRNIDGVAGMGAAAFASKAIQAHWA